jgi:CheY-like chemotaxis protein
VGSQAPGAVVVLVVDDHPPVRALAVDVLSEAGFRTIEATSVEEALGVLRRRADVGVLLTDVNLSKPLDGYELALAVGRDWPDLGIVMISGGHIPGLDGMPERSRFVRKPYTSAALVAAIRDVAR